MENSLIILAGLPGTGKTTIAKKIYENLENYILISQNEIRRRLGIKRMPKTQETTLREIDRYCAEELNKGKGVIIDSVNRYLFRRHQLYGIASCCGKKVLTLEVVCSEETAKNRIKNRLVISDGLISDPNNPKVYDKISKLWENISLDFKYPGEGHVSYISYDSEKNTIKEQVISPNHKRFINKISKILIK